MQDSYKKTIGIIGGKGKTGSQFAHIFRKLGFKVIISDIKTKLTNSELIECADIVVFSVPLHLSEQIIKKEAQKCKKKNQLVMDVSSLKEKQVKAMNKAKGEVIGMHPLFGPSRKSYKGLSMIFCPGHCQKKILQDFKKLFEKIGIKITVMQPSEHDKLMAVMQVIPHLKTILAGELLREFGINPKISYEISTPIYKLELDIIGRIFSQDGLLYSAIISQNPYSKSLLRALELLVKSYRKSVNKVDLRKLTKRFNDVKVFLGDFLDEAFCDSERIINEMQKWK